MSNAEGTMRAARVLSADAPKLEIVEQPIPTPAAGHVRVRVEACGICHSDALTVFNHWPGLALPRVPGHEIAGRIDALGDGVTDWKIGDRV